MSHIGELGVLSCETEIDRKKHRTNVPLGQIKKRLHANIVFDRLDIALDQGELPQF